MYTYRSVCINCFKFALFLICKMFVKVIKGLRNLISNKIFLALICFCVCFIFWTCKGNTRELKKTDNPAMMMMMMSGDARPDQGGSRSVSRSFCPNPVILWWTGSFGYNSHKICPGNIKCNFYSQKNISDVFHVEAFMFYASSIDFEDLPLPRKPNEIIWGLLHEESPRNQNLLLHEKILKLFNYSSTISRHSDIPFPLHDLNAFEDITSKTYFVKTLDKNHYLSEIAPVFYLQTDCQTSTERDAYVKELMKFIKVDSYGRCLNNRKLDSKFTGDYLNHLLDDEFLHFVARYKFVIAIENGVCEDYITEKFWRAIKVGSVPIYFGSPSIRDWLPNSKSAILVEDFPMPKILSEHLNKLLMDDKLYEEYLEHKVKAIVSNDRIIKELTLRPYQTEIVNIVDEFECLICKKVHERRNGIIEPHVIDKSHYNCPIPVSALTLAVNPENLWVSVYTLAGEKADKVYERVMNQN